MINLLPHDDLKKLKASKQNNRLLLYIFITLFAGLIILGMFVLINFSLDDISKRSQKEIEENNLRIASYADIQKKAQNLSNDTIKFQKINSQKNQYSDILIKIAQSIPSKDITISNIQIDSKFFTQPVPIVIEANDYNQIIAAKDSFEKSNLMKNIKIVNISTAKRATKDIMIANMVVNFNKAGFYEK